MSAASSNPRKRKPKETASGSQKVKTPVLLQMHAAECGAACLGSVLAHFGRWVPLTELRERCEVSRDGSSAAGILRAARHYGMECRGMNLGAANLLRQLPLPSILFWQYSHFVVLEGHDDNYFYLNDPAIGRRRVTEEEFDKAYSRIALRLERGENFKPGGERPGLLEQARAWLGGTWQGLAGAFACGLALAVLALAAPAAVSVFVDESLTGGQNPGAVLAALLGGCALLVFLLSWLKNRLLRKLSARISIAGYSRGLSRLLRLPVSFFNHRMVGDLTDRVSAIDRIAKNLTERFLLLTIDMAASLVFLAAMLWLDFRLGLIVLALAACNAVLAHFIKELRSVRADAMRREQGLLLGMGMQMLSHADGLRMVGADDRYFSRWAGQQALELDARKRYAELGYVNTALPGLMAMLAGAIVLAFGAGRVVEGDMTLGALAGFYFLAMMFLAPVGRFVEFADMRQDIESDLHRLEDITRTEEDPAFTRRGPKAESLPTFKGRLQLTGQVELRNVSFGYNRSKPPLIKDFNLVIKPGQRVAIVGPSGSGKSTVSRLVSGLNQPWSGEILFDGQTRHEIPEEVLQRSISAVDQDVVLFSATVRDNITLWNSAIPDEAIIAATRDACVHEDILRRPLGYATPVEEGGVNFSGGQRQRLEIARALVGNPTVLILDEATSALDAATEEWVEDALRRRGVTCLIVAHRMNTVRDCDEIIVLDNGVEVQRGTHDELMENENGVYFKLVSTG